MVRYSGSSPRRRPPGRSSPWRVLRTGCLFGLLVIFVGLLLGAAYAFTPVHDLPSLVFGAPTPLARVRGGRPVGTPSPAAPAQQIGADTSSVVDTTAPSGQQTPLALPSSSAGDSRFAFLLLGYGGGGHDGAYLTDSMMLVVADPTHKTLTLLSIPRDSWVPLYFDGTTAVYNKINTAYAFAQDPTIYTDRLPRYSGAQGPGNFALDTVSRLLGVPIQYYLGMDFQGFRDMINTVGGVDVNVPDGFAARYPINDNPSINAGWTVVRFSPGLQHMDGERAIEYARAREAIENLSEGSDFARSRRQRLIMEAFKTRLLQPGGLIHLPQLLSIASQHVDTNYTVPDVAKLSQLILGWKDVKIYQTALTTSNYLEEGTGPDGTYLVVPSSPDHTWAQIRAFTRHLWANPAAGVAMASTTIVVENDTDVTGLAGRVSDALAAMGYQVGPPTSGPVRAQSELVDPPGDSPTALAQQLETDLGLPSLPVTSDPGNATTPTLVLHLGTDEADLSPTVPTDPDAPSSTVGVVKFGVWPYVPTPPTAAAAPRTAELTASPSPTPPPETPTEVATATPVPAEPSPSPTAVPQNATTVVVPKLVGLPLAAAQNLIVQDGLMTTYVNYQTIDQVSDRQFFLSIPPGHVLSQTPLAGAQVPRGTRVYLAVRKS